MTNLRRAALVCSLVVLTLAGGWSAPVLRAQSAGRKPVASAGLNQTVDGIGTSVQLDGSGSSDPAGLALNYHWTIVEAPIGSMATLTGADTATPLFVPDRKGRYRVQLVVDNGSRTSNPDVVVVAVRNTPPIADAGTDRAGAVGETIQLDGSASSDVDGDPLTFQWNFMSRPRGSRTTFADPTVAQPTFLVDKPGRYIARLVVNDGQARAVDSVFIDVPNTPPVASAGPDQSVAVVSRVILDGSGSTDVDGDRLRYTWTLVARPDGSSARLANRRSVQPSFVVDVAGNYVVTLTVNDGHVDSALDSVIVSTGNSPPVANAGPDQTVVVTEMVHLDGSASTDVDGNQLTYAWTFVSRPDGSAAVLSNPTAINPTFVVDRRGAYQVGLVVNDGLASSLQDLVAITVENSAPVASAGADQKITLGATVTLNGSGSTDVDGDALTYMWSLTSVPDSSTAALNDPAAVMPTFVADASGTYVAHLIVSDGSILSAADTVSVMTENVAPVANAGVNQAAHVTQLVFLDGTGSSDADGDLLTFQWSFTTRPAGSAAMLAGPTTAGPSFTPDRIGFYVVQLIVSDGVLSSAPDTVTISSINVVPIAQAGPDQVDVPVGSTVFLSGLMSSDAEGQPLTYRWSLLFRPGGSSASLDDLSAVNPSFTADLPGDYVAQLVVNDGMINSAPDTVLIRAVGVASPVVAIEGTDDTAAEAGPDIGLFTVTRAGPTDNGLTVHFSIAGQATNGSDYSTIDASVVIPAGASSVTIAVTPIDDVLDEGSETVIVTLSADPSYTIGSVGQATVTIADNDGTILTALATVADATEAGPAPGTVTFTRTGDTSAALSFSVMRGGTASESDYAGTSVGASFLVTIPAAQASVAITITPVRDNLVEGPETVVLTIEPSPGYTVGAPNAATVTIADDPPVVNIVATDANASETGPDTGAFAVTRAGGDLGSPLIVSYAIGGTATNNSDYALIASSVTMPATEISASITVTPIPDALIEGNETIALTLTASLSYTIGPSGSASLTIHDPAANDGLVAYYPFNGNADDASGNGNHGTVVGAVLAADRVGVPASAYLFGNNPNGGAMSTDYITIPDSPTLRPQTGLTVSAWINTLNPAGRSIVGKQFGFGAEDSYLLWYNVGTLWFTLYPFGSASVNAPIPTLGAWHHVAGTWDGSAITLYVDGIEVASSAFAGPNEYDESPVVIGADNDNGDELPEDGWDGLIDEVRIYNRALSADEIRELEPGIHVPVVAIKSTDDAAAEAGPDGGLFTIIRTGPTDTALTVHVGIAGQATNGTDYTTIDASVVIPAGTSSVAIAVTPIDDVLDEGSETVIVTLSADPSYAIGSVGQATVTIADNDGSGTLLAPYYPAPEDSAVPDQYIVRVSDGVGDVTGLAEPLAVATGGSILTYYDSDIRGFAIRGVPGLLQVLRQTAGVADVWQDFFYTLNAGVSQDVNAAGLWALDRIDQRDGPLDGRFAVDATGLGVVAYVIDSGVRETHDEIEGRVLGIDFTGQGSWDDCHGHGTGMAGAIGGRTTGVAKNVFFYALRVVKCDNILHASRLKAALEWLARNRLPGPAVANLSIGVDVGTSGVVGIQMMEDRIRQVIASGVTVVVSAGNNAADAGTRSPARMEEVITVGATNPVDTRAVDPADPAKQSNYGAAVDIFAPGDGVLLPDIADPSNDSAMLLAGGTSVAAALVSGAAALYLEHHPNASHAEVKNALLAKASPGRVHDAKGAAPHLLYVGSSPDRILTNKENSCALRGSGEAWCWGENFGMFGNGSLQGGANPVRAAGGLLLADLDLASGGSNGNHACGIDFVGVAYCWGDNSSGQLGIDTAADGTFASPLPVVTPMGFPVPLRFLVIEAGSEHSCGIAFDGQTYCWGKNSAGEVGDGTLLDRTKPTLVAGGLTFKALTSGKLLTCGLERSGLAYCWGFGAKGELGNGAVLDSSVPVPVSGGLVFEQISAFDSHVCGVTADGAAYCWGFGISGQLGNGSTSDALVPVAVATPLTFAAISGGDRHSCGVANNVVGGTGFCWGENSRGQLGVGGLSGDLLLPAPVAGALDFRYIAAGEEHSCGITVTNTYYCWGHSRGGMVGNAIPEEETVTRPVPVAVP